MSSPTGPTPPPPFPYSPAPQAAQEPLGPGLSEGQRLTNVFLAPTKTFEDLKRNSSWWVPWLIASVFGLIFGIVAVQKVDMRQFAQQQLDKSPLAQRQLERLTPEQREQNLAVRAAITKGTFYAFPVFQLIVGLIAAAVLMAVFNFILGAEVSFARALGVVFYAGIPGVIRSILLMISLLTSSDPSTIDLSGNPMPTNPGFFLDPQGNKVLYSLASALDIFIIWYVVLLGLGFAAASMNRKPSKGTGIATVFVCYGIMVLIGLGFKLAFS
jgi:hypothetical protein